MKISTDASNTKSKIDIATLQFKDDNYFGNLFHEMLQLVLMENTDNEIDEIHKNFILDVVNNKVTKKLAIRSQ